MKILLWRSDSLSLVLDFLVNEFFVRVILDMFVSASEDEGLAHAPILVELIRINLFLL